MLRIAQAASSENYSAYGIPPNQRRTGVVEDNPGGKMDGELNVVQFYGGWEKIFRPKDQEFADRIAWMMTRVVMNGKYGGYGQASFATDGNKWPRTGLFDALMRLVKEHKEDIPDPMHIEELFNCDCSSSTGAVVYHCGVKDPRLRDMWTGTQEEILMSTGMFDLVTDPLTLSIGTGLRRGDILWMTGHTAIAIDTDDHYSTIPYWISNCYACNIRMGPSTEYNIITVVHGGDIVYVIDPYEGWKLVETMSGEKGYVSGMYCSKPLSSVKAKGDVWLRQTAGKDGIPIIVMQTGETVYVTGAEAKVSGRVWKECIYANHRGWASSLYV